MAWIPFETDMHTWKRSCRVAVTKWQRDTDAQRLACMSSTALFRDLYAPETPSGCQPYLLDSPLLGAASKMMFALRSAVAPLNATLYRQGQIRSPNCSLCGKGPEDTAHFMLHCASLADLRALMWRSLSTAGLQFLLGMPSSLLLALLLGKRTVDDFLGRNSYTLIDWHAKSYILAAAQHRARTLGWQETGLWGLAPALAHRDHAS